MKSHTTADRLKQIMKERNLRQVDILELAKPYCEKYGVKLGKNDLSQYVSGHVEPGQEKLSILGMALNVSEVWLMGYDVPMPRETKKPVTIPDDGLSDIQRENINLIMNLRLTPEQEMQLRGYLQALADNNKV